MSVSQDALAPNGADLLPTMDQLKLEDNEPRLGPDGEPAPKTDEEYAVAQLTLRAIVSSKEAGVIIGKGGKNVADLRDETGVKAGVSKVVQGVHDRVLTISGGCDAISRAYAIVARALLEGAPAMGMGGVIQQTGTHRESPLPCKTPLCCARLTHLITKKSSYSSPTIRWVPSSVDKVSRLSTSRTSRACAWLRRRRCYRNRQNELLRSREILRASSGLSGKSASVWLMIGSVELAQSSTIQSFEQRLVVRGLLAAVLLLLVG